jgi:hypothetical protein
VRDLFTLPGVADSWSFESQFAQVTAEKVSLFETGEIPKTYLFQHSRERSSDGLPLNKLESMNGLSFARID